MNSKTGQVSPVSKLHALNYWKKSLCDLVTPCILLFLQLGRIWLTIKSLPREDSILEQVGCFDKALIYLYNYKISFSRVIDHFCYQQTFILEGLSAFALRLIYMYVYKVTKNSVWNKRWKWKWRSEGYYAKTELSGFACGFNTLAGHHSFVDIFWDQQQMIRATEAFCNLS